MFQKLKQFKDIRDKAKVIQNALSAEKVEGSGGWGKVKVTMDGNQKILNVAVDDSLLSDKKSLEGAVRDAVNDAVAKIQKIMAAKMKDLGGDELARDVQSMMKK
jgi:DNA-binding YbaB/EbfC family protein